MKIKRLSIALLSGLIIAMLSVSFCACQQDSDATHDGHSTDDSGVVKVALTEDDIKTTVLSAETSMYAMQNAKAVVAENNLFNGQMTYIILETKGEGESYEFYCRGYSKKVLASGQNIEEDFDYSKTLSLGPSQNRYLLVRNTIEFDSESKEYAVLSTEEFCDMAKELAWGKSVMRCMYGKTEVDVTFAEIFETEGITFSGVKIGGDVERYEIEYTYNDNVDMVDDNGRYTKTESVIFKNTIVIEDGLLRQLKEVYSLDGGTFDWIVVTTTIEYDYNTDMTMPSVDGYTLLPSIELFDH